MTKEKRSILVVDDEKDMLKTYENILKNDYSVLISNSGEDALSKLKKNQVDVAILDIRMPKMDGIEVLKKIKSHYPYIDVIMATGSKDVAPAVECMKLGAFDYINKPFDVKELLIIIEKALQNISLIKENAQLKEELKSVAPSLDIIGKSPQIERIRELIKSISQTDSTVLISGESGVGKEVVARAIHNSSKRQNKPFIAINCAAIPENLLESELFGFERGAFTGAVERKIGKFELADSGTLFLDEIGCMSPSMQSKLLRILEEKSFERLGGNAKISVDVRIISATNIDFDKSIKDGKFREDLYYRLNVIPINIPPLRDRREDIPLFVASFINKFNKEFRKNVKDLSPKVFGKLMQYGFPGNVRELQNLLERAVVLAKGDKIVEENIFGLGGHETSIKPESGSNLLEACESFEREFILKSLKENNNNQTTTAEKLGIARTTLSSRLKALGIRDGK